MNDDDLMATVGRVVRADRPPDDLVSAAKASFDWIDLDTVLMALVEDSAADELVAVRDVTLERLLVFEDADGIADITIRGHEPATIEGRLDVEATIRLERPGGAVIQVSTEPVRMFELSDLAPGPIRLVFERSGGTARSEWITI